MLRARALERITGDLGAWNAAPVLAYGFEDLTGAEWRLLEALAARVEVHVSLPYEPGRVVFASLSRTAQDLSRLAGEAIVELPPRSSEYLPKALAHLERRLFEDDPVPVPLDGSIRFLEGAGRRATLELVGEEVLQLDRRRHPAGGDRGPVSLGRSSPCLGRDGVRGPGCAHRTRRASEARRDAIRPGTALAAALCVGWRRPP